MPPSSSSSSLTHPRPHHRQTATAHPLPSVGIPSGPPPVHSLAVSFGDASLPALWSVGLAVSPTFVDGVRTPIYVLSKRDLPLFCVARRCACVAAPCEGGRSPPARLRGIMATSRVPAAMGGRVLRLCLMAPQAGCHRRVIGCGVRTTAVKAVPAAAAPGRERPLHTGRVATAQAAWHPSDKQGLGATGALPAIDPS